MKSLTIWDIDDTLFRTTCNINVVKNDEIVESLSPCQFNSYRLKQGEEYDFSEFRSAKIFANTAVRVDHVFKTAKKMMERLDNPNKRFILVTARGSPDCKETIKDTFRKHGFDIDRTDIFYSGDVQEQENIPAAEAKKIVVRSQLRNGDYDIVRMFDDSVRNIQKFMELQDEFHNIKFEAFLISPEGEIRRV